MEWGVDFIEAKYHLSAAKRMRKSYSEYPEKRFLIGTINELSKSVTSLIRAFLIYEQMNSPHGKQWMRGNKKYPGLKDFLRMAPRYMETTTCKNLIKIFEIKKLHKISPIELMKEEKIILLIYGEYRILTVTRIGEFIDSVGDGILAFPGKFRQV